MNNRYVLSLIVLAIMGVPASIESAEVKKSLAEGPKPTYSKRQFELEMFGWAAEGAIGKVKNALGNGADINAQAVNGETMLMLAVSNDRFDLVKFLLEQGAKVQVKNKNGETAYDIARDHEHEKIVKLLEPIVFGSLRGQLDRKLTRRTKKVREKADVAGQALAHAICGDLDLNKFDYSLQELQDYLLLWAQKGDYQMVHRAIASGVDIDAVDDSGNTALMEAASGGHLEIVKLLIKNETAINPQNERGYTALMNAAENGYKKIVKILLNKKANVELKNNDDETAYDLAKYYDDKDHKAIAELLREGAREMVHQRGL